MDVNPRRPCFCNRPELGIVKADIPVERSYRQPPRPVKAETIDRTCVIGILSNLVSIVRLE